MNKFYVWFAHSAFASALRTAIALGIVASLSYVSVHIADFHLPVLLQVALVAAIPPLSRVLNPEDPMVFKKPRA